MATVFDNFADLLTQSLSAMEELENVVANDTINEVTAAADNLESIILSINSAISGSAVIKRAYSNLPTYIEGLQENLKNVILFHKKDGENMAQGNLTSLSYDLVTNIANNFFARVEAALDELGYPA